MTEKKGCLSRGAKKQVMSFEEWRNHPNRAHTVSDIFCPMLSDGIKSPIYVIISDATISVIDGKLIIKKLSVS